jgi:hypothetical protein
MKRLKNVLQERDRMDQEKEIIKKDMKNKEATISKLQGELTEAQKFNALL